MQAKNFRTRRGEIDLIMLDNDTLVFVEVKYRKSTAFGIPQETITPRKRERIIAAALAYLQDRSLGENHPIRFDAIAVCGNSFESNAIQIDWLRNIFD